MSKNWVDRILETDRRMSDAVLAAAEQAVRSMGQFGAVIGSLGAPIRRLVGEVEHRSRSTSGEEQP